MAEKTKASRAESKVTDAKKKSAATGSASKSKSKSTSRKTPEKKQPEKQTYDNPIPSTFVVAFVSICLFVLFLVIAVNPDGALLKFIQALVPGLIGQAGFYFAIPGLLYLFVLNTFLRKKAVRMRSFCVVSFVFLCGCIYHLSMPTALMDQGIAMLPDLYMGGIDGSTGGLLCGGFAMLMRWACGKPISLLIIIVCAVLCLLGAMQITIPSIIRAIINRPREDWDDDEDDYIEPAALVVNHIANKKIEQKRQRREQQIQQRAQMAAAQPEPYVSAPAAPAPAKKAPPVQQEPQPLPQTQAPEIPEAPKPAVNKGAAFMSRVDSDIGAPLPGTAGFVREDIPNVFEEPVDSMTPAPKEQAIPSRMPELKKSEPLPAGPRFEQKPKAEAKRRHSLSC